jgi:hypothetical protein
MLDRSWWRPDYWMIWDPKDASASARRVTENREMILETRTRHTYPAAFPQIDHQNGSSGVRLRDRSDDAGRRVEAWRSPGLRGRVFLPANGQPEFASPGSGASGRRCVSPKLHPTEKSQVLTVRSHPIPQFAPRIESYETKGRRHFGEAQRYVSPQQQKTISLAVLQIARL